MSGLYSRAEAYLRARPHWRNGARVTQTRLIRGLLARCKRLDKRIAQLEGAAGGRIPWIVTPPLSNAALADAAKDARKERGL